MFGAVCFMVRQWMARLIFWVIVGHFSKLWIVFGCLQFRQHKLNRNKIAIYCSLGSGDLRNWCISPKKSQSRTSQLTYSSRQIRHQQLTDCCLHIEIVYICRFSHHSAESKTIIISVDNPYRLFSMHYVTTSILADKWLQAFRGPRCTQTLLSCLLHVAFKEPIFW